MEKTKIIIVGAGMAGLMAAKELSGQYDVVVLEGAPRLGGRIHTMTSKDGSRVIEAGAEFIHGKLPLTLQLLKEAGIDYVPVEGEMYRKQKEGLKTQDEMVEGWDELLKKMKDMPQSMTMHEFLEQYYTDKKNAAIRRHATSYAEGFDGADIKKASVRALYKEWSEQEEENFRIPRGYGSLVNFMQRQCEQQGARILTNKCVKRIYWEKDKVTVYAEDGERFDAQKAIIAVPLTVFRNPGDESSIRFIPALDNYVKAANDIGVGAVLKVVLQFDHPFWKKDTGFILSDEVFPTWWTQLPDAVPMLTGWIGGPRVASFTGQTKEQILEKALQSLCSIFEIPMDELKENLQEANVFNWQQEGAYSYGTPGTPVARKLLNKPIQQTLFFAGEGLYEGSAQGTVEAAIASGKEAVKKCKM